MSKALFVKQLTKGKAGELAFREMAQSQWDEVYDYMRENIYRAVMAHEVGHTVGLRHNFGGSMDPMSIRSQLLRTRQSINDVQLDASKKEQYCNILSAECQDDAPYFVNTNH